MYETYRPSPEIMEKARRILKRGMPSKRIQTSRAIDLRDECDVYLRDLLQFENIPPYDVFVAELRDVRDAYQEIIDRRMQREQFGDEQRLLKELHS